MINPSKLQDQTLKHLAVLAKKKGVAGWHEMRKDQLIRALSRLAGKSKAAAAAPAAKSAVRKTLTAQTCAPALKAQLMVAAGVKTNGQAKTNGAAKANGHDKTNGQVKTNGTAKLNGHTKTNGEAKTNGHVKSNGLVKTNGHVKTNGVVAKSGAVGKNGHAHVPVSKRPRTARMERRLNQVKAKLAEIKDLAFRSVVEGTHHDKDRIVVIVRDPYWLQVYWELTRRSLERARVAMGQNWHGARPILRLHEVSSDGTTSNARRVVRQIDIHGGVNTWYVDVKDPPKTYQVDVGYLALNAQFYSLARSNVVSTPQVVPGQKLDNNWTPVAHDYDRIFAMSGGYATENVSNELREVFEEQLRRPMGPAMAARYGLGATEADIVDQSLNFEVDAELIIFGAADPGAQVSLRGEPVKLESDGSFMVRFGLPDRRQVFPIVANSPDGGQQRTVVLAVERNTKVMEPVARDSAG